MPDAIEPSPYDSLNISDPWADDDERTSEPMRPAARGPRRNPSREDRAVRRRMRRAGAQEENSMPSPTSRRSELMQRIASAPTLDEQMKLAAELHEFDRSAQRQAALEREADLADTSIREAFTPVISATARGTTASDWLDTEVADAPLDHGKLIAQAALWFKDVPDFIKADREEFEEQAIGKARQVTASMGGQAKTAEDIFFGYASFLRTQAVVVEAGSGLDQIQQTTAPDGVTNKPTPLPPDTFDNFAPPVADINTGVTGTETSSAAPAIQMSQQGGNSSPEVPGGHSETGVMTGPGAEPSLSGGGGNSAPERAGGHSISGDIPAQGGPTSATPQADPAQPETEQTEEAGDVSQRPKTAASGLEQIQQTINVKNEPQTTPLPTTVAFPWTMDEGGEAHGMTGDAQYDQGGEVSSGHQAHASRRVQADQWTQPNQIIEPNIANSERSTPPRNVGQAGDGAADARAAETQPSFGDAHAAPEYTQGYTSAAPAAGAQDVPYSMGGDNGTGRMHPAFASRRVASKQDMQHPDFQRGYKYAARFQPGTPIVRPGSPELEAGIYAGFTDNPRYREAWLSGHARLAKIEPSLGHRILKHRELTHKVASAQALPTDGTYLQVAAATGIDLDTTNPSTSPSPTGDTPINGPGKPGPLAGGMDAAAPAGASPYNGTEPFGQSVVPQTPAVPQGQAVTLPDTGMASAYNSGSGLSPTAAAFRRRVQAGLLAEQKGA